MPANAKNDEQSWISGMREKLIDPVAARIYVVREWWNRPFRTVLEGSEREKAKDAINLLFVLMGFVLAAVYGKLLLDVAGLQYTGSSHVPLAAVGITWEVYVPPLAKQIIVLFAIAIFFAINARLMINLIHRFANSVLTDIGELVRFSLRSSPVLALILCLNALLLFIPAYQVYYQNAGLCTFRQAFCYIVEHPTGIGPAMIGFAYVVVLLVSVFFLRLGWRESV